MTADVDDKEAKDSDDSKLVDDELEISAAVEPELVLDDDDSSEPEAEAEALLSAAPPSVPAGELVRYDPLESYLAEIRHIPTLTREEEHELAVRFMEQEDKMAGYKLVMANLKLVVMIAREYQRNAKNILDLVQEGNIGLLQAVEQYDPYRGTRFPSYAVYWVRAYMLRYLINNIRLVKVGTTQAQRKLFFNLRKEKEKLEREGFAPEAKLLANRLGVKESEVIEMEQRLALPDMSVDAPLGAADDETFDMHSVLADSQASAEDVVVRDQFVQSIRNAVEKLEDSLDEKEQAIIDQRLLAEEPATLQSIAETFGLSRERIRQIESKLKQKLKAHLAESLSLTEGGEIELELD